MSIVGVVGCVLPALPGLPLVYVGVLLMHFTDKVDFTTAQLLGWLFIVVILQILDYITPVLGNKYSGGTSYGNRGSIAGTILGLFFMPWGIVLGPFLGALFGELLGGNDMKCAIRSGLGALVGFVLGTLLKIVFCGYLLYVCIMGCVG